MRYMTTCGGVGLLRLRFLAPLLILRQLGSLRRSSRFRLILRVMRHVAVFSVSARPVLKEVPARFLLLIAALAFLAFEPAKTHLEYILTAVNLKSVLQIVYGPLWSTFFNLVAGLDIMLEVVAVSEAKFCWL